MTDDLSPLDAHASAYRTSLGAAATRHDRRARRTRRSVGVAVPLALAATVAVAAWPGDDVNVLDRATAALTPRTGAVHFKVTSELLGAKRPGCQEEPADVWLETGPNAPKTPRWRFRINSNRCATGPVPEALGHIITGRNEVWYDGKNKSTYANDDGWVEHLTDVPARDVAFPDPTGIGGTGQGEWWETTDPISNLRTQLSQGRLKPAGTGTIDGRRVRFLAGHIDTGAGTQAEAPKVTLRIAVDANSFAPVEVTQSAQLTDEQKAKMPDNYGYGTRVKFLVYETAPAKDLAPLVPAGTESASRDYRAFRKEVRAAHAFPPKAPSAAEQARADKVFAERHPGVTPSPKP